MLTKINREPVVIWTAIVAPILMSALTLLPVTENTVGALQAVVLAVTGLVATTGIKTDGFFVALTGFAKAIIALFLTFNLPISEPVQTFVLTVITIVSAAVVERPQVDAKVQPSPVMEGEWHER